ncbi:S-methyl-5'-thioadenosine phosphorylase [Desulfuromonas acetoxidans]|uniref:S-methyl-5'-thioadenosine phosphorylase n=1 Tax=Desulfuromonas acetoxidans (strain DSM 684 / 11070) TaxID=281689 RepID=Q1K0Y1_DESA6|nr:S-methyl-5'-thioadenosine phosphorylase [Desulfuromonas acetoxidans]EAT16227.1 Methylthioadenosine phosphorylase [Desulfuromonas acetoxidans DSM 684]MBF0645199.1 S-methyl-5'-thioadenosine phosphorylase [Desulfuromonas acetoxidans]NVD23057.1 S-methyl-5'-thioadenosine phosphorylase [Desulfuromonas acetoxidans]NVE15702.1 S-methyl-5'-thioadenosine phosphorylase [Desulfuromonas acetoxidans]
MAQAVIGVIGGSGLYEMENLQQVEEVRLQTPFGEPSDAYITGMLGDVKLVFLPRHGRGHRLLPSEVPYRANIYGMKMLGVEQIISVSAVGSMKEEIVPGHIVIPDQFFDRTTKRASTFFGDGVVGHIQFADPVCPSLSEIIHDAAHKAGATVHNGGTYICIEGPNFSTRAESLVFRSWGVDVIGMTNLPEARLAREAEICYATVALATDYDCWHQDHDDVSVEAVIEVIHQNVAMAKKIVAEAATLIGEKKACGCGEALKYAVMTDPGQIPAATRQRLDLLLGHYLEEKS